MFFIYFGLCVIPEFLSLSHLPLFIILSHIKLLWIDLKWIEFSLIFFQIDLIWQISSPINSLKFIVQYDKWRNTKPVCTTVRMRTLCSPWNRISFGRMLSFLTHLLWMCAVLQFNIWYYAADNCVTLSCLWATWDGNLQQILWWKSSTSM